MKTKFTTLIATVALFISTTSLTYASTTNGDDMTALTEVGNISQIEANGNVEVYITSGAIDGVTVYDNYYAQGGLVQSENGVLRVSSYKADKLVILVTVTDLRSIVANGNAIVKSYGNLSVLEMNVQLNDNATAQIKMDALTANITVNDHAKADLSGDIFDYQLAYSQSSTVNRTNLTATNIFETRIAQPVLYHKHAKPFKMMASL